MKCKEKGLEVLSAVVTNSSIFSIFWEIMLCSPMKVSELSMDYMVLYPRR
jgi:hypothetical protein